MNIKSEIQTLKTGFNAELAKAALIEQSALTQIKTASASWPVRVVVALAMLAAGFVGHVV